MVCKYSLGVTTSNTLPLPPSLNLRFIQPTTAEYSSLEFDRICLSTKALKDSSSFLLFDVLFKSPL
jgi:hypothetical protein